MENQPIPTQIPTPEIPLKSSKFPLTSVLLVLLSALLLFSTGYLYYQNMQLKNMLASYQTQTIATPAPIAFQSPVPSATTDPTANWKTYINKEYNFTVKYPSDAKLRINQSESSDRMLVVAFDSPNAIFDHLFKSGGYSFEISMQTQKNFNTLDEYLSFQKEHSMYGNVLPKTYNNVIGYLFKNDKGYSGLSFIYQGFLAKNNDLFYTVNYFTDENLDMFNQILSTFKFTN